MRHNFLVNGLTHCLVVQRVHWLRARSQMHRWDEEVKLVGYEMVWTVRYFVHQMEVWDQKRKDAGHPGAASYAARKAAMWCAMARDADQTFSMVNRLYTQRLN